MGRSSIILFLIFFSYCAFAQGIYTSNDNKIYDFLDQMQLESIISDYDDFNLPLTRKQISEFLIRINEQKQKLSITQREILEYYLLEYDKEINKTDKNINGLIGGKKFVFKDDYPKYFYYYYDSAKVDFLIKTYFNSRIDYLNNNEKTSSFLGEIGGAITSSFYDIFGFEIFGANGLILNKDKKAALYENDLRNNFKLNEKSDSKFFDNTFGYVAIEHNFFKIKLGSDKFNSGYGYNKLLIGNFANRFNYFSFNLQYKSFYFDYFHGSLISTKNSYFDSSKGVITEIPNKYIVKHQLRFSPWENLSLSFGELVIYSNRNYDLGYLNPFNFFKSVEHSLGDRDNGLLFTSVKYQPTKKIQLYSTLLIDDIDFEKIGTDWYGNQFAINIGFKTSLLSDFSISRIRFEYTRINPYVYSHRILTNNYYHNNQFLGSYLNPNSEEYLIEIFYKPKYNFQMNLVTSFRRHGENIFVDGKTINYGGDVNLGHRPFDSEKVKFLDGNLINYYIFNLISEYELLKDIKLKFELYFEKNNKNTNSEILFLTFGLISFI